METRKEKFLLLFWKDWKLQIRHPVRTLFQFLMPIFLCLQLFIYRTLLDPLPPTNDKVFTPFEIAINKTNTSLAEMTTIAWSPCSNNHLKEIMENVARKASLTAVCFPTSAYMVEGLKTNYSTYLCGVEFSDSLVGNVNLPKRVKFSIRFPSELRVTKTADANWRTDQLFPAFPSMGPRSEDKNEGAEPEYNQEGFLTIQKEVSMALITHLKKTQNGTAFTEPKIRMQRFAHPEWIIDPAIVTLREITSLVLLCCYLVTALYIVKELTNEKEMQVKEAMKMMGLQSSVHWAAWFAKNLILFSLMSLCLVIVLKAKHGVGKYSVLNHSDSLVILFVLVFYSCATITLCFAISVFFLKSSTAVFQAFLIWFLLYIPYQITRYKYTSLNLYEKLGICLCSNSGLALAFVIIFNYEGQGVGLQWKNLILPTSHYDPLTIGYIILTFIFDTFFYLLIAVYVDTVYPGRHGIARPWYFPLTLSYWRGKYPKDALKFSDDLQETSSNFEMEPTICKKLIEIDGMMKIFPRNKVVVQCFDLNMFEGQITVLLGHDGAGKTTLMNMISGVLPPSLGTAIVNGYDVTDAADVKCMRKSFGICPQYNVIFNELTVEEHFQFYGALKGLNDDCIDFEIAKYAELLELKGAKKCEAGRLHRGARRKLCIGIALCGHSRIVLLDEPTAGVDPVHRHTIWNVLQKEKQCRTILLSTHCMDEADMLGDRIAIMVGGRLQCCGSSFFLKKKYGSGYHLTMEKSRECDVEEVTKLLATYIPTIQVASNVGSELSYSLNKDNSPVFEQMLKHVERESERLGILGFGISLTTLEEVFMKVGAHIEPEGTLGKLPPPDVNEKFGGPLAFSNQTEQSLDMKQCMAIYMKKTLCFWRAWFTHFIQIAFPVLFAYLALMPFDILRIDKELPPLDMSLSTYHRPITLAGGNGTYFDSFRSIVSIEGQFKNYGGADVDEGVVHTEKMPIFRRHNLIGASFRNDGIIAWFNNEPYHSPPLALEYIVKAVVRSELGEDFDIDVENHPQPPNYRSKMDRLKSGGNKGLVLAVYLTFSLAFCTAFFIIFYIKERSSGFKQMQFISGVKPSIFWGVAFLYDLFIFIAISVLVLVVVFFFYEEGYNSIFDLVRMLFLLILFAFVALPMTYLTSFLFTVPSSGFTFLSIINLLTGVCPYVIVTVLLIEGKPSGNPLHFFFLLFPHYNICSGIYNMDLITSRYKLCNTLETTCLVNHRSPSSNCSTIICANYPECCNVKKNYFSFYHPGISLHIIYLIFMSFFFFGLLLALEYDYFQKYYYWESRIMAREYPEDYNFDDDVETEKERVGLMPMEEVAQSPIVTNYLTKCYGSFVAVNQISIGFKKFECFGLLGFHGAGKTTFFKMLTGTETVTLGNAWVRGWDVKTNMKDIHKSIGYCPQNNSLLENLTGRETLLIHALIQGVPILKCKSVVEKIAYKFDFLKHISKRVKKYSGGTKRKLCTAVALLGGPQIIFLDEPTSGMDPGTKRRIWNMIIELRDEGKCIVLTTHSMAECEAVCTRLTIMVNGTLRCLGSKQYLKQAFSDWYTLIVRVRRKKHRTFEMPLNDVRDFVKEKFPSATEKYFYMNVVCFAVSDKSIPWSAMFGIMEEARTSLSIEDYSISQASMEEVFQDIIRFQRDLKTDYLNPPQSLLKRQEELPPNK